MRHEYKSLLAPALILAVAVISAPPARADAWLVFRNGQKRTAEVWIGPAPTAPLNIPPGSIVLPFIPENGDVQPANYLLQPDNVTVIHDDEIKTDLTPRPNPAAFFDAVTKDATIAGTPSVAQAYFAAAAMRDTPQDGVRKMVWTKIKGTLPAGTVTLIESYATTNNMPLK